MKHLTKFLCVIAVVVVIMIGLQFLGNGKKVLSKVEAKLPMVQRQAAPTGASEDILDEEHPASVSASSNLLPNQPVTEHMTGSQVREQLVASDLLPSKDVNAQSWGAANPEGAGSLEGKNFLQSGHHVGINTVGQTLRNANLQLRSEPPNPQVQVSPWQQSTINPDVNRRPMEIGGCA